LTGPSSWQSQALAQSCVWRGSRSASLIWSRRCATVSWLRRLSGLMPEPSMADAGVALWMASLGGFPANPIPSPESGSAGKTSATCGARPGGFSSSPGHGSSSSRTSAACSVRAAPSASVETFSDWAARLRADSSRRRKLARARNASGFSSSAWPTARVSTSDYTRDRGQPGVERLTLEGSAKTWPTPTPTSLSFKDSHQPGNSASMNQTLALASGLDLALWPTPATPATRDFKGVDRQEVDRKNSRPLNEVAAKWATPRATDGEKGGPNQCFGAGGVPLPAMASQWQTPSVGMVTGGQKTRSKARSGELLLNGQAEALSSLQAPETSTPGAGSPTATLSAYRRYRATACSELRSERRALLLLAIRRRARPKPGEVRRLRRGWTRQGPTAFVRPSFRQSLNPSFVGDLMGWPPGLTSFACSEMASSTWRERMRSALWSLPLPAVETPVQPSLFG
jgi:hypothetical protein